MRLASIGGVPFSHELAENVIFNSNTTLLDYDILLWNPDLFINEYFNNAKDKELQNEGIVIKQQLFNQIIKDINRRDREMNIMLENGKNIFIYTPYPIYVYTTETQTVNLLEYFSLLRARTSSASGKRIEFRGDEVFASFWEKNKSIFEYVAMFDEASGKPLFYIQGTQFVVGSYVKVKKGYIVFLPLLNPSLNANDLTHAQDVLNAYIQSLIALDNELHKSPEEFVFPEWSNRYILPHEYEQKGDLLQLEEDLNAVRQKVGEKKRLISELVRNKILFLGTGDALVVHVKKVFEELGFTVIYGEPGRDDLILKYNDKPAVVEVKGKKKSASEADAAQLEKWVSDYLLNNGVRAKGLLIVNAFKEIPLKERVEVLFPVQMQPYSVAREHCLLTGLQLLGLYLDCKDDDQKKHEMIDLMFATNGIFSKYQDWTNFIADESKIEALAP